METTPAEARKDPAPGGGVHRRSASRRVSWIAVKMLVGDRAKFLGIVMGLTFASLLITQQGSIFCGLMLRTCAQITDITGADLWVMDPAVRYIDDVKPMLENNLYRVRGVEGVLWAVPLYKGQARAKINPDVARGNQETVIEQVILLGLDDATLGRRSTRLQDARRQPAQAASSRTPCWLTMSGFPSFIPTRPGANLRDSATASTTGSSAGSLR